MNSSPRKTETRSVDGETRKEIMLTLLHRGLVTVADVGEHLGLAAAGVRRHLDILVEEGLAESVETRRRRRSSSAPAGGPQRGRPAKKFRLTDRGREYFGHSYDMLAAAALRALAQTGGPDAVREFARQRVADIIADIDPEKFSGQNPEQVAQAVVDAFCEHGYAATLNKAAGGVQICQHHCPISQVAAEFPEICEAEHEIVAELTGRHIQTLASIAEGHGICTTNIPLTPIDHTPKERS
ncbi:ArsR family transcriptional regulator [Corynebacterium poyangense]|uniref:ArsR family transcriptional regulator n=1 Tax=Corynebacterium poyangense TaxID=2684405 RepID=A0A7H0SNY9_9CORY|nr:metalloregulator ArsR/SmtB family transcription factor [Corynebacterium poyangense]QNQ90264.1 ArsR family transcriptional regulator [Corynebacterium poyangense]